MNFPSESAEGRGRRGAETKEGGARELPRLAGS